MEETVKYSTEWFDVVDREGYIGVVPKENNAYNVVILPYITQYNRIVSLGILHEWNPFREGNYSHTLVTGDVEIGETPLNGARRELYEETGYLVKSDERWKYLGKLFTHKSSAFKQFCWAVNIRDIKQRQAQTDGSKSEKLSDFKLIDPSECLNYSDCYIQVLYLRLLNALGKIK